MEINFDLYKLKVSIIKRVCGVIEWMGGWEVGLFLVELFRVGKLEVSGYFLVEIVRLGFVRF